MSRKNAACNYVADAFVATSSCGNFKSARLDRDSPTAGETKTNELENVTVRPVACFVPLSISLN
jgi:hypothetical protein